MPLSPKALSELQQLGHEAILYKDKCYTVFNFCAFECPVLLEQIGRIRANAFHLAPVEIDLDIFDQHYKQIVVLEDNEIIAGARCITQDYALRLGLRLYTESLYQIAPSFYRLFPGLLELGRLFVNPTKQGNFRPLLLLWQGIANYWARVSHVNFLLGSVSFQDPLIGQYLLNEHRAAIPRYVQPRFGTDLHIDLKFRAIPEMPAYLKLFLKMGAKLITVGRDPYFHDQPDALMVIDLNVIPEALMRKFMGNELYERWRKRHKP